MNCINCGKALSVYDIGFHKKLVNRGAREHTCIECTAEYFGFSVENAWKMIERFQKTGCTLFPDADKNE